MRPRSGWRTARAVKPPEQMREVLRLQVPDETYHAAFGALLADLSGPKNRGYELAVANRLFGQAVFPFATSSSS